MAQPKVSTFNPYHIYDERAVNILKEPRQQLRFVVFVVASSKPAAVQFCKDAQCSTPRESDLKLAFGNLSESLRKASLLNDEGVILVTADRGGEKPVVLMDPKRRAQAIGIVRPEGQAYIFQASMADYAGVGSIAVGTKVAWIKTDEGGDIPEWHGTNGEFCIDTEMQRMLDRGELKIIRSGFGDWYTAGR